MQKSKIVMSLVLASTLTGCAAGLTSSPLATDQQSLFYSNGIASISERSNPSEIGLTLFKVENSRLHFSVDARNIGSQNFDIGAENFSVFEESGRQLHVYQAHELIRTAQNAATAEKIGTTVGVVFGVLGSIAASTSTTTGTANTPYGPVSYTETRRDPAIAAAGSSASIGAGALAYNSINRNLDAKISQISQNYLQTNTVGPGQRAVGVFEVDAPRGRLPATVKVELNIAGRPFEFDYAVLRVGTQYTPRSRSTAMVKRPNNAIVDVAATQDAAVRPRPTTMVTDSDHAIVGVAVSQGEAINQSTECTPDKAAFAKELNIPCSSLGSRVEYNKPS